MLDSPRVDFYGIATERDCGYRHQRIGNREFVICDSACWSADWEFDMDQDRRRVLQGLSAGVLGYNLGDLLALQTAMADSGNPQRQARNVLVIYEEGGISQMDTWDPKPDAPADHRSPYHPISTNVPGIQFTSLMPMVARHADKLAVVRSMTSTPVAGHIEGCLEFMKGYRFNSPLFQGPIYDHTVFLTSARW